MDSVKKIAIVSPRLPADGAIGGAETLLLNLAKLATEGGVDVTFLTTCSTNVDGKWSNDLPSGESVYNGIKVIRFPVNTGVELKGLCDVNSDALIAHIREVHYDRLVTGPYLFGLVMATAEAAPDRTILVPCVHDEEDARSSRVRKMFRAVRGFCFNTEPERDLAAGLYGKEILDPSRPCGVVGFALPDFKTDPAVGRKLAGTDSPYIIYCGRRDPMKGTPIVVAFWAAFRKLHPDCDLKLVLTGIGNVDIPEGCYGDLIDLGDVADEQKRHDLMAGAIAFCHASVNESLSIVLLESWLAHRPVLVHGNGVVLRAQTIRANGGLWFRDFVEFNECLETLLANKDLADAMGESGRKFTLAEYSPESVRRRFIETLNR